MRAAAITIAVLLSAAAIVVLATDGGDDGGPPTVTVDVDRPGQMVPAQNVGLSVEWDAIPAYRTAEFPRLLRRLANESGPPAHLRVGGNSSDQSWWNPDGDARPRTVLFDITPQTLDDLAWIVRRSGARVTLGLNLALNDPDRALAFARAAQRRLPPGSIAGLEIGNEPDLYTTEREFDVGPLRLRRLRKRATYDAAQYERELHAYLDTLSRGLDPARPLIVGGFAGSDFLPDVSGLLEREGGRVGGVSTHLYALRTCEDKTSPATLVDRLLDPQTTRAMVDRARPVIDAAGERNVPVRVTELNSAVCGGVPGVSDTAAAALWLADALFALVDGGAAGADVHGFPGAYYAPIDVSRSPSGRVTTVARPPYDGMLLFARAAPGGSRRVPAALDDVPRSLRARATVGGDGRARVLLTSVGDTQGRSVRVVPKPGPRGCATVERLSAPRLEARDTAITSGERICPDGDVYRVRLDRAGAVLLTFATRQSR
jgi:hypothetical protein